MVDDGLYTKVPVPDLAIGAHVMPYRSGWSPNRFLICCYDETNADPFKGTIGTKHGLVASSADSFRYVCGFVSDIRIPAPLLLHSGVISLDNSLTIHGRGSHASMPNRSIDPIVQASSTILRLQTIVAREVDPSDFAVVTVAAIHAGDVENVIPDRAELKLDVRAAVPETRERVLASMRRIIDSEATASDAPQPPELRQTRHFPFLFNDSAVTNALEKTFSAHFAAGPHRYLSDITRMPASEDFGILATSIGKPSCFFLYGGTDPEVWDKAESEGRLGELPGNHSPYFAPVIQPTLTVAVDGYIASALTFLGNTMAE